jgi:hypothetical protein
LFAFHGGDPKLKHTIRLRGLEPGRRYRIDTPLGCVRVELPGAAAARSVAGNELVEQGVTLTFPHSGAAAILEIEPVRE